MRKTMFAVLGMAAVLAFAAPASAELFTTEDGVLSIETPENSEWIKTSDPKYWFTITNGNDVITIDHLSNGENLPAVQVADDNYAGVFEAFVSTKNEVFVVKAQADQVSDLQTLMLIVSSIKVLKYDTKTAITKSTASAEVKPSDFALRSINAVYYVNATELNVRGGFSTDDVIVGTLKRGEEVQVIGAVTKDGKDYGWYKISYKGQEAYVSAELLSQTKEAAAAGKPSSSSSSAAGKEFQVYDNNGSLQGKLVGKSDGYYYSNDGMKYKDMGNGVYQGVDTSDILYSYDPTANAAGAGAGADPGSRPGAFPVWDIYGNSQGYLVPRTDSEYFTSNDGMYYRSNGDGSYSGLDIDDTLYSYVPDTSSTSDVSYDYSAAFTVWDINGNPQGYLYPSTNSGYYYSGDGMRYSSNGDGSYYGVDTGETLYNYYPGSSDVYDEDSPDYYYHGLTSVDTGEYKTVSSTSPNSYVWTDGEGTDYQNNGDGTFTDYYGNEYYLVD